MTREWEPGDVAMVNNRHDPTDWKVALCVGAGAVGDARWILPNGASVWTSVTKVRPLVPIDPDDLPEVERLAGLFLAAHRKNGGAYVGAACDAMQAALREYADPKPPRPDEPTGLGAVVEDAKGGQWVRVARKSGSVWQHPIGTYGRYADIDAVRVLSEGVQS